VNRPLALTSRVVPLLMWTPPPPAQERKVWPAQPTEMEYGVTDGGTVATDPFDRLVPLNFAVQADGATITTVEGLAPEPGALSVLPGNGVPLSK